MSMKYSLPSKNDLIDAEFVKIVGADGMMFGFQYNEQTNTLYYRNEQIIIPDYHGSTHISTDLVPTATTDTQGHMSANDKAKLDNLAQMRMGVLGFTGDGIGTDGGWITGDVILAAGSEFISLERVGNIIRFNVATQIPACTTETCASIYWIRDETEVNAIRPPACSGKLPGINGYGEMKIYLFPESKNYNPSAETSILAEKGSYPCMVFKRYDDAITPNSAEFEMVLERHSSGLMKTGTMFTPGVTNVTESGTQGEVTLIHRVGVDTEGNQLSFTFDPETEPNLLGKIFYNNFSITTQWGIITSYPSTLISHNHYKFKKWIIDQNTSVGEELTATNIWQYNDYGETNQALKLDITKNILPIGAIVRYWEYIIHEGGTSDIKRYFINREPSVDAGSLWSLSDILRFGDIIDRADLGNQYNPTNPTDTQLSTESLDDKSLYENSNWGLNGLNQPLYLFEQTEKAIGELVNRYDIDLSIIEGSIKHVFIYDTSEDSENWRIPEDLSGTSWYGESKDSTNRGGDDMFPTKAILICANHFYVFDASDGSLWMRFQANVGDGSKSWDKFIASAAKNGNIYVIQNDSDKPKQLSYTGIMRTTNEENWTATAAADAPVERSEFAYGIYNNALVVWGGSTTGNVLDDGRRFNMHTNTWATTNIAATTLAARANMSFVQFGDKLFIWGGRNAAGNNLRSGAIYDMATNTWTAVSANNAPSVREAAHIGYYNGKIIIWGGWNGANLLANGAIYDVATNSWTALPTCPLAGRRHAATAIINDKFVIAGGGDPDIVAPIDSPTVYADGAYYDFSNNTWTTIANMPTATVWSASAKIDGDRMIVWGGQVAGGGVTNNGWVYDLGSDAWSATAGAALGARMGAKAVFDGSRYITVFGGMDGAGIAQLNGEIYDLQTDAWAGIFTNAAGGDGRWDHALVSWHNSVVIFGGQNQAGGGTWLNDGGIYTLGPYEISNSITPRYYHAHCSIGTDRLFVHGGYNDFYGYLDDCWIFDVDSVEWTQITGCPLEKRAFHTATYDEINNRIFVWGGFNNENGFFEDGAIYDVAAGTWTNITTQGCPQARGLHTAVWCDDQLIIWGGITYQSAGMEISYLYTGGIFDGTTWTRTSVNNPGAGGVNDSPAGRIKHTAIVYNNHMYVLGGCAYTVPHRTAELITYGDFYNFNPATGVWTRLADYTDNMGVDTDIHTHTANIIGDTLYVTGGVNAGFTGTTGQPVNIHNSYDLAAAAPGAWAPVTEWNLNHTEHSSCEDPGTGHYSIGGVYHAQDNYGNITEFTFSNIIRHYDIVFDNWTNMNSYGLDEIALPSFYLLSGYLVIFGGYNKGEVGGVRWIDLVADTDKIFTTDGLYSFEDNKVSDRNTNSTRVLLDDFVTLPSNINYDIAVIGPSDIIISNPTVANEYTTYKSQFIIMGWSGGIIINNHHDFIRIIIGANSSNNNGLFWSSIFRNSNKITASAINSTPSASTDISKLYASYSHDYVNNHESIGIIKITDTSPISIDPTEGMRFCKTIVPFITDNTPLIYNNQFYDSDIRAIKAFNDEITNDNLMVSTNNGVNIIRMEQYDLDAAGPFYRSMARQRYDRNYVTELIIGEPTYCWLAQYENDFDFTRNIIPPFDNVNTSPINTAIEQSLNISNPNNVYKTNDKYEGTTVRFNDGYLWKDLTGINRPIPDTAGISGFQGMNVEGRFKFDHVDAIQYLISQWNDAGAQAYRIYLGLDRRIHVDFGGYFELVSDGFIIPDKWYKINITWTRDPDSANSYGALFINGALQDYNNAVGSLAAQNFIVIGAHRNGTNFNDYFNGLSTHISVSAIHDGMKSEFTRAFTAYGLGVSAESALIRLIKESYDKGNRAYISNPSNSDNNKLFGNINDFHQSTIDHENLYYASDQIVGHLSLQDDTKKELLYNNTTDLGRGFDLSNSQHIAYWKCDDGDLTLRDFINNNDGTCYSPSWLSTKDKTVLGLDGTEGFVVLPSMTFGTSLFLNFWFHTLMINQTGTNQGELFYFEKSATEFVRVDVDITVTSIDLIVTIRNGANTQTLTYHLCEYDAASGDDLYQQYLNWTMITIRVVANNTFRIYANRNLKASVAINFGLAPGVYTKNYIGTDEDPATKPPSAGIFSDIVLSQDTSISYQNIYNLQQDWFYKYNYRADSPYIEVKDNLIVYQGDDNTKKLILQEESDELDKVPNVSDINMFYRGKINSSLPGMVVEEDELTGEPKHPIFIWNRQNHKDTYTKILLGRPSESKYPPIDVLLRAPIDSHDTRYFEITERGIINHGALSGKHFVICKGIRYKDLSQSGYVYIVNGSYTGYMWKYTHKFYGYDDTLVLAGDSQFPFTGDIVNNQNPVQANEPLEPEEPIVIASMPDNYTTPVLRLEFSIVDQTTNKTAQLQFKAGILDMTYPYELNAPDTVTDNLVRGLRPNAYTVSKVYSQTNFVSDPNDTSNISTSDNNFIIYNGGYYNTAGDEQWNQLEILYRAPQLWVWWNNLLITPLGDPTSIDSNANPTSTQYFPMDIDFPVGKIGLRLWPGAKIRQIEIRDKLRLINEYARI